METAYSRYPFGFRGRRGAAWWALSVSLFPASVGAATSPPVAFRLLVAESAVYAVSYAELRAAGLEAGPHPVDRIALRQGGRPVPVWFDDGGDGTLDEGDAIEFVGEHLAGPASHFDHDALFNVYQLRFDSPGGARMRARLASAPETGSAPARFDRVVHAEADRLLIRLSHEEVEESERPDLWFWHKLTHIDPEPVRVALELRGLDSASDRPVSWSAEVRGLSQPSDKTGVYPDHELTLAVNDGKAASVAWNGRQPQVLSLPDLDPSRLAGDANVVSLEVPRRVPPGERDPVVDVVMLNWVEVRYPWDGRVDEAVRFHAAQGSGDAARLTAPRGVTVRLYGDDGDRVEPAPLDGPAPDEASWAFDRRGVEAFWAVPGGRFSRVARVEADAPSDLKEPGRGADYLILTHARLAASVEPLAEFHRGRGLRVEVIDVQDIYDEFRHGIQSPVALRDFVAHAYRHWTPPAPRYVLLVGDASWDIHNPAPSDDHYANWVNRGLLGGRDGFHRRQLVSYAESGLRTDRGLVPTWQTFTHEGQAASDNYFVAVDGDDWVPDLAIGRFPVTEPEEVAAIVDKILGYAESEVGPWRRRALLISNEWDAYKRRNDSVALSLGELGFASVKVYPSSSEVSNEGHQARLLEAFDGGQLLVHFAGHGGRFIWRTGPPDPDKNHDLFTLDHLDQLRPTRRLPVVLSVTCHSGPFDHPQADSIAEKFLRLPGRGALAVVAASWRSNPGGPLSVIFAEAFSRRTTIGEAFLEVKERMGDRYLVEGYNLLGDPALPLALPRERLELRVADGSRIEFELPEAERGASLVLDWLDDRGTVVSSQGLEAAAGRVSIEMPDDPAVRSVAVYAWDPTSGWDAAGGALTVASSP